MGLREQFEWEGVQGWRVGRFAQWVNTNCYLYRFDGILIDTGPPNQWPLVRGLLKRYPVVAVYVTHHHEDHGGNSAWIAREFSLPIFAHPLAVPFFENGFPLQYYRKIIWGKPRKSRVKPFPDRIITPGGRELLPIHTPGHTIDMVCFYLPQKGWLFTGDLFITTRPRIVRKVEDPLQEMESLRRVLRYDFQEIFCSHRGILKNGRRLLQEKLDFLETIYGETARLLAQGRSIPTITRQLLGNEGLLSWITGFHFARQNLIEAFARDIQKRNR